MNILVADDDERILRLLNDFLTFKGYTVFTAANGKEALDKFNEMDFDLVILDVMMPIYDGWVVCKEIRRISNTPIIMLTCKDSDIDQLFGFEIGIDDYITKPFNIELVAARVQRLLKKNDDSLMLSYKNINIDLKKHKVLIDDIEIILSPTEYKLLIYFMKNIEIVISRDTLLQVIWSDEYFGDTRTVDTHINRLRNKLSNSSNYLKTIRGFGYKLGE
ncbi:MAG: response regulator transcription factor [Clostridium sp.]